MSTKHEILCKKKKISGSNLFSHAINKKMQKIKCDFTIAEFPLQTNALAFALIIVTSYNHRLKT